MPLCADLLVVIAGLDPAIHEAARRIQPYVSPSVKRGIMDARVEPGHDAWNVEALSPSW
jgi:hypothetical protein